MEKQKPSKQSKHSIANKAKEIQRHVLAFGRKTTTKTKYQAREKIRRVINSMLFGYRDSIGYSNYTVEKHIFGSFHQMIAKIKCGCLGIKLDFRCTTLNFSFGDFQRFLEAVILGNNDVTYTENKVLNNFVFLRVAEYMLNEATTTWYVDTLVGGLQKPIIKRDNAQKLFISAINNCNVIIKLPIDMRNIENGINIIPQ